MNLAVRWSDAEKRSFMRAVVCFVSRYPVDIGQLPMDLRMKVGECFTNVTVELSHAGFVGRHVWLRCVVDKVVREEFLEDFKVPTALHFFGIPSDNSFRCVGPFHDAHTSTLFLE